ncbi:MAG: serine/threonine protein kinase, partial [Gammaproteobacteria bacterium]
MSTHANALPVGYKLDEYLIGRLLGHGGFGLTYLAQDTNLNALVAIKEFLPQEFALRNANSEVIAKSEFDAESYRWGLDRFKEEARALARFKHPNIVRVSRLIESNGTAYMVMDFEPGMTLSQYLKRYGATLDEDLVLGMFLPVLDGLEALHRLLLVHRDIKPSNIYVRAY